MADAASRAARKMVAVMRIALETAGYDFNALDFQAIQTAYHALLTPEEREAAEVMDAEADAVGRWTLDMARALRAEGCRNVPPVDEVH